MRAVPATWELTEAFIGAALELNQRAMATLVVLGFVGMPRTAEMMDLTYQHLVVHPNHPDGARIQDIEWQSPGDFADRPPLSEISPGKHATTEADKAHLG